jgi:hypothetical protein
VAEKISSLEKERNQVSSVLMCCSLLLRSSTKFWGMIARTVPDPNLDPDPPDSHVFGPPGSGSINQRHGSGFFCHQAKIVRKHLFLLFCDISHRHGSADPDQHQNVMDPEH